MGKTDTTPIEPVVSALSLSGDKDDPKKNQPGKSKRDYEKELEDLSKELANCKVQLEAKHVAHMRALLKVEHNQKMTYELSTLMKKSDLEKNKYMNECIEGRARIQELESKIKHMTNQHPEMAKIRDQLSHVSIESLSHVSIELKATQKSSLSNHSKAETEEKNDENSDEHITISLKEYKSLVREAKKANEVQTSTFEVGSQSELAFLKKELEATLLIIVELRAQAEEALSRAELAEKGKAVLEDRFKRQREHRLRKRAALAALQEVSTPELFSPSTSCGTPKAYQPLSKVLNMKL